MITECVYEKKMFVNESLAFPKKNLLGVPQKRFLII